jgi:hypothetical protein
VSCSFSPSAPTPPANGNVNSTLTVTVGGSAPTGSDSFQVTGTNGPTTKQANLTLNVTTPPTGVCAAPTITNTTDSSPSGSGTVTIAWNAVPGASQYRVQRQDTSTSWSTRTTTSNTSFSGSDLSNDPNWRVYVYTSNGSCTAPSAYTTFDPGPPPSSNTGWRTCTSNSDTAGGDGNGFQSNPSAACADGGSYATDSDSGNGTSTSCSSSNKDRHLFFNYGFSIPSGATINGIEVRLDSWADSTSGSPKQCVEISWNGGQTWTAVKQTSTLSTSSLGSRTLGSSGDKWGRTWSPADFANGNFIVRVTNVASSTSRDFRLDWIPVRVSYTP